MKIKLLFMLLLIPTFSLANSPAPDNAAGEYVFDCTYPNSAWRSSHGFYIDNKGNIIKYEVTKPWREWVDLVNYSRSKSKNKTKANVKSEVNILPDDWSQEEENRLQDTVLAGKFQSKEVVGSLPTEELQKKVTLILSVAKGKVTQSENIVQVCEAYSYDKTSRKYTVLPIGSFPSADGGVLNISEGARVLLKWLQGIEEKYLKHNRPVKR